MEWSLVMRVLAVVLAAGVARPAAARIEHVIHISVDGLRGDLARDLVTAPGSQFHAFGRLVREGAVTWNARCDSANSLTIPNHTSMITGRPVLVEPGIPVEFQHGYTVNFPPATDVLHLKSDPPAYQRSTFDVVHDHGGRTALLASKQRFQFFDRSFNAENGAPDTTGEDNGRDKIDLAVIRQNESAPAVATLLRGMDDGLPAYTFLHISDPDFAGHTWGWGSQEWILAVRAVDTHLALILSALDLRPALRSTTAIVLTADHGGGSPATTHGSPAAIVNITIPLMLWGPGIPSGVDAYSLFSNRFDPGAAGIDNLDPRQPLRNGDTAAIVLALLDLPLMDTAFFRPAFRPLLDVRRNHPGTAPGSVSVLWPGYLGGWSLEATGDGTAATWLTLPASLDASGWFRHTELPRPGPRLFRLRGPAP